MKPTCPISVYTFMLCFLISVCTSLSAQEAEQVPADLPRTFSINITTLKEHGFGTAARIRYNHIAFEASGNAMPWLLMIDDRSGSVDVKFGFSYHVDASLIGFFNNRYSGMHHGLRLGGIMDGAAGYGMIAGYVGDIMWERFYIGLGGGIQYYPDFRNSVRKFFDLADSANITGGNVQIYLGVNFGWYLY
jgi:hypothetical protein